MLFSDLSMEGLGSLDRVVARERGDLYETGGCKVSLSRTVLILGGSFRPKKIVNLRQP